jgi:hypothetical protein
VGIPYLLEIVFWCRNVLRGLKQFGLAIPANVCPKMETGPSGYGHAGKMLVASMRFWSCPCELMPGFFMAPLLGLRLVKFKGFILFFLASFDVILFASPFPLSKKNG